MAVFKTNQLVLDHAFDRKSNRHSLNGWTAVFHCHHYTSLYSQLAIDASETQLLADCAEEAFFEMLTDYFNQHAVTTVGDRLDLACQYFAAIGLGQMVVDYLGDFSGQVTLNNSHVDSGWIKKWGQHDAPVNYITAGYCSAMFAAALNKPLNTFSSFEVESIVTGAEKSTFKVTRR